MKVKVIENHDGEGSFETFLVGSKVEVIEDCAFYLNWQKCKINNVDTYIPKHYISNGTLNVEHNPTELICKKGDELTVLKIVYGWLFASLDDKCGWVPAYKCLSC